MSRMHHVRVIVAGCFTAWAFVACGGGGGGTTTSAPPVAGAPGGGTNPGAPGGISTDPGAPTPTNNIAVDGRNWINYRRSLIGLPTLTENAQIDIAAQGHSDYLRTNNTVAHEQVPGKPGFTGVTLADRLNAAGWTIPAGGYAYGEVISATTSSSGAFMAEELITAIYHRFAIFQPMFKEIGTGAATTAGGYSYFTADFGARNGWGPGIARGTVTTWPYDGQTQVTPNFFSDYESPDPMPSVNEVGYPISVEGNLDQVLAVQTFTVRPRGGSDLPVRLLVHSSDAETPSYAAAIIPNSPLRSGTTYDVTFTGTATTMNTTSTAQINKTWSFTTK